MLVFDVDLKDSQLIKRASFQHSATYFHTVLQPTYKVRDWVSILPPSVTLWNAYRDRKDKRRPAEDQMKVPQSFTFMAREGWHQQKSVVTASHLESNLI